MSDDVADVLSWYILDDRAPADVFIPIGHKRRPVVGVSPGCVACDNLVEATVSVFLHHFANA
jgi:hypothetical protein